MDRQLNVLLVEDSPTCAAAMGLGITVADRGIVLDNCCTLRDAIDNLSLKSYNAVILDLILPDSAGVEAVVAIRKYFPDIPVIVVTSLTNKEVERQAIEAGASDYIIKDSYATTETIRSIRHAVIKHDAFKALKQFGEEIKEAQQEHGQP